MFTRKNLILGAILAAFAILLPLFNVRLSMGNPNFGTTPVTLAGIFLPWPFAVIIGLIKGISTAVYTGRFLVELPVGVGDALMGLFTAFLARRWYTTLAAFVGQLSRFVFSAGLMAIVVSIAIAMNSITPANAPVTGLSFSFWDNIGASWLSISFPAIFISMLVNAAASIAVILLFDRFIYKFLGTSRAY
jgi:hypothetical protein